LSGGARASLCFGVFFSIEFVGRRLRVAVFAFGASQGDVWPRPPDNPRAFGRADAAVFFGGAGAILCFGVFFSIAFVGGRLRLAVFAFGASQGDVWPRPPDNPRAFGRADSAVFFGGAGASLCFGVFFSIAFVGGRLRLAVVAFGASQGDVWPRPPDNPRAFGQAGSGTRPKRRSIVVDALSDGPPTAGRVPHRERTLPSWVGVWDLSSLVVVLFFFFAGLFFVVFVVAGAGDSLMPVALVTGAGVRVGRAIALALADAGYDVALHAHSHRAALDDVAAEVVTRGRRATLHTADLSNVDGAFGLADDVLTSWPVLDVVVHNAALFAEVPFDSLTPQQWRQMQAVNVEAPVFLTQRLLPALRRADGANVVCIADVAGERPIRRHAHYCVSKAALLMLVKTLALELAPIRVNAVGPGAVAFPDDYDDAKIARILARVPLARTGDVGDVAAAVVFLATQRYITGQMIAVDGGRNVAL
jgi:pteridine reductase